MKRPEVGEDFYTHLLGEYYLKRQPLTSFEVNFTHFVRSVQVYKNLFWEVICLF